MLRAHRLRRRLVGALITTGLAAALPLAGQSDQSIGTVAVVAASPVPAGTSPAVLAFAGSLPSAAESTRLARAAAARAQAIDARLQAAARAAATRAEASRALATRAAAARASRAHLRARLVAGRTAAHAKAKAHRLRVIAALHHRNVVAAQRHAAALAARTPGDIAVEWARKMLGRPYEWGSSGPSTFDCSGLTSYVWRHAGVELSHYTGAQFGEGRRVERSNLRPGDLVFFGGDLHHVGIYIGDGMMISAPHTGDHVRVQSIDRGDYAGAVRPG